MKLTFLGTRGEIEARSRKHRRHSAFLVSHGRRRVMVDCGVDWVRLVHRVRPHAIVLTHAHPDHAFGLAHGAPCPVWATAACWETIGHFPIDDRRTIRSRRAVTIEGVRFEAFDVEHSLRAPAVGYRIGIGRSRVFYAPDLVFIHERAAALRGVWVYVGDGATLTRPLVRKRGERLIGHASVATQLAWCETEGVPRALITHCGTGIVTARHATMVERIQALGAEHGVDARLAWDGMSVLLC